MKASESCGFQLRASENWVFIPPESIDCIVGNPEPTEAALPFSVIHTIGQNSFEVVGKPDWLASLVWPIVDLDDEDE